MKDAASRTRNAFFLAMIVIFVAIALAIFEIIRLPWAVIGGLAIALVILSVALVVLTARLGEPRRRKTVFMLTGLSAVAIPVCAVLHNLVYALCIVLFGEEFWGEGGDEPVFFILAVIVCPAVFLTSATIGVILLLKGRMAEKKAEHGEESEPADVEK